MEGKKGGRRERREGENERKKIMRGREKHTCKGTGVNSHTRF